MGGDKKNLQQGISHKSNPRLGAANSLVAN